MTALSLTQQIGLGLLMVTGLGWIVVLVRGSWKEWV